MVKICPICKKFVPTSATACPSCGNTKLVLANVPASSAAAVARSMAASPKKKSKAPVIISLLAVLAIVSGISAGIIFFLKSGIIIENGNIDLKVGESSQLDVTTEHTPVTYESADTSIATVDSNGTVTAVNAGSTTITATNDKGRTANCTVTISHIQPTSIEFGQTEYTVAPGQSISLEPVFIPKNTSDRALTYSIDQTSIATVDGAGTVTGVSEGTATFTAKSANGVTATCTIIVLPFADSVSIESALKLAQDETGALTATFFPEPCASEEIVWTSSDENIATVVDGQVTAVNVGTATITAETAQTHLTASCTVTVGYAELSISSFSSGGYSSTSMATTNMGSYFSKVIGFKPTATATGGSGGYQYKFDIIRNGSLVRSSGWQSSASSEFSFSTGGTYTAKVTVRDSRGATATASETATIS